MALTLVGRAVVHRRRTGSAGFNGIHGRPGSVELALLTPNVVSIAAFVTLVVAIGLHVRVVEEPYLTRVHGEAYLTYARRVGRLVPGVGLLPTP